MSFSPLLQPLLGFCNSAELTVCGLMRVGKPTNALGWAVNAFSVLRFSPDALPIGKRPAKHLTTRPESSPDGRHQLFVAQSILSVPEALTLCAFQNHFADPCAPAKFAPVECPGTWVDPVFVEDNEQVIRSCLPPTARSLWVKECWQSAGRVQAEIGPKGVAWLHERVRTFLGVSLASRRERIGNFLVALPEMRVRMRVQPSQTKESIGVEIQAAAGGPTAFVVVARGLRDEKIVCATSRAVPAGLHVLPMQHAVNYREVDLYDAQTGLLLDRDAGVPLRDIGIKLNMITTRLDIRATFVRPDGTPDGEPVHVQTDWGVDQGARVGGRPAWEEALDAVRAEERKEELRNAGRFFVYRGGKDDRQRAVADIRKILHTAVDGFVKIWDPYFGHRDAFEFLFYVLEPTTPIQVLTSFEVPDVEKASYRVVTRRIAPQLREGIRATIARIGFKKGSMLSSASEPIVGRVNKWLGPPPVPLAEWKRRKMNEVLKLLREPRQGSTGLSQLELRAGGSAFHDRFIISHGRCWQLGCSFNQIGNVMSTIVEFPYPEMIEREFDEAWQKGRPLS